jgi:SAM-dependent methyltransferase
VTTDLRWDAAAAAAFYDAYGEREWTRFEDGRTPSVSIATHAAYLRRFVRDGDRVLDAGCGPGRFTIELARIGARIVASDLSPGQLDLHRRYAAAVDDSVEARIVADVSQLPFDENVFDAAVCYGGALSYLLERGPAGIAELARVTRPGGHVLVSVMSLVGTVVGALRSGWLAGRGYSNAEIEAVAFTGLLPAPASGHPAMKLYRASELHELLARHGAVVAVAATGLFEGEAPFLERLELDLGAEPGAVDIGPHILAVLEVA